MDWTDYCRRKQHSMRLRGGIMFKIKLHPEMGRGVFSAHDVYSWEVCTVFSFCELLVLNTDDTRVVNTTELKHYTFKYNETQDCLVLGIGELFNHSDTPNVSYHLEDKVENGITRKVMAFRLLKPVTKGEQLFIDYNADVKVNTEEYINSKSMVE